MFPGRGLLFVVLRLTKKLITLQLVHSLPALLSGSKLKCPKLYARKKQDRSSPTSDCAILLLSIYDARIPTGRRSVGLADSLRRFGAC